MLSKLLLVVFVLFLHSTLCAWTITDTFEAGTEGQICDDTGASYSGTSTVYSTTRAHGGTKSCRMTWTTGEDGWNVCHLEYAFFAAIQDEGEVWLRVYVWLDDGWAWNSAYTKFLRVLSTASSNEVAGRIGMGTKDGYWYLSNETTPDCNTRYDNSCPTDGDPIAAQYTSAGTTGEWISVEVYIKAGQGDGVVRLWRNGILFAEQSNANTIGAGTGGTLSMMSLMDTWNSPGSPGNQVQYFDDLIITNETPSKRDAAGNMMIGPTDWASVPIATGCTLSGASMQ